jgi:uncharacterized protein
MAYGPRSCFLAALAIAVIVFTTAPSRTDETSLVKACDGGSVAGCEELVRLYGAGPNEDRAKWAVYADKACSLNSAGVCNNLGVAWSTGRIGTGQADFARGSAYYRKACDLSHGLGCFNVANMQRLGEGVAIDMKLALENYTRSCDLGEAKGCNEVAIMHYEGKVVEKNVLMAMALFQKACKLGSTVACRNSDTLFPRVQQ